MSVWKITNCTNLKSSFDSKLLIKNKKVLSNMINLKYIFRSFKPGFHKKKYHNSAKNQQTIFRNDRDLTLVRESENKCLRVSMATRTKWRDFSKTSLFGVAVPPTWTRTDCANASTPHKNLSGTGGTFVRVPPKRHYS